MGVKNYIINNVYHTFVSQKTTAKLPLKLRNLSEILHHLELEGCIGEWEELSEERHNPQFKARIKRHDFHQFVLASPKIKKNLFCLSST